EATALELEVAPVVRRGAPTRELDEERPGGEIPGLQALLPVSIVGARRDEAEVEGRRAAAPDALRALHDGAVLGDVRVLRGPAVVREPRGEERVAHLARGAHPKRIGIDVRACVAAPPKQLA